MDPTRALVEAVDRAVAAAGSDAAIRPGHRKPFHWPPHPISYEFHLHPTDWSGEGEAEIEGERFPVKIARTRYGVFVRSEDLWHESKGDTEEAARAALAREAAPLFDRQRALARALGREGRFTGPVRDLSPTEHLLLLWCDDRDVAYEARNVIETHPKEPAYLPGLLFVLRDRRHPMRRSAQWCVLDLFEQLPVFAPTEETRREAIEAMAGLLWDAEDDYCRAVYKAGVVLGGHLPEFEGGRALLRCLDAPSTYGRRSAIHGLFHVVEWMPEWRDQVVAALRDRARKEKIEVLRDFAVQMALDIERDDDHVLEPALPGEES